MLRLEFPNETHKQCYIEMMDGWKKREVTPTSPWRLFAWENYEEFLKIIRNDISQNENAVNSHLFFFFDWEVLLWSLQIRHTIEHPNLKEIWGHIGYGLYPSARGKWYATEMLRLGLIEAGKLWLKKVLITCTDWNIPSLRVIEKNGGVFEGFIERGREKYRRYWIQL